jgi:hypothetical protein
MKQNNQPKSQSTSEVLTNNPLNIENRFYFILNILIATLLLILPFQTILVQFLINKSGLPSAIALWKEALVVSIVLIFAFDLGKEFFSRKFSLINQNPPRQLSLPPLQRGIFVFKTTLLYLVAVALISLTSLFNQIPLRDYILGFRFELFWVGFLAISIDWVKLKRGSLTKIFDKRFFLIPIYIGFLGSLIICLTSVSIGTENFYSKLGYGYSSKSTDIIAAPTCHVIDYTATSKTCRLVAGFSSPNHFSAYLLLVLSFFIFQIYVLIMNFRKQVQSDLNDPKTSKYYISEDSNATDWNDSPLRGTPVGIKPQGKALNPKFFGSPTQSVEVFSTNKKIAFLAVTIILSTSALILIYFTYSRYTLIALSVIGGVYLGFYLYAKTDNFKWFFKFIFGGILFSPVLLLVILMTFFNAQFIQNLSGPVSIIKPSSTTQHYRQKNIALEIITKNPKNLLIGYGLGQSGPTAQKSYNLDPNRPIIKENYAIADKYLTIREEVAIPENWYFQLVLNGGIIYFFVYITIVIEPLKGLFGEIINLGKTKIDWTNIIFGLGFFGVFVGNLFLHVWENQAVSVYFVLMYIYYQVVKATKVELEFFFL